MKLAVLSGKGGVGKSMVASSLLSVGGGVVGVDADVDANNLMVWLKGRKVFSETCSISKHAVFTGGEPFTKCPFGAIREDGSVNRFLCEGCGLCAEVNDAYHLEDAQTGELEKWVLDDGDKVVWCAQLTPGEKNSGKLVDLLIAKVEEEQQDAIIDCAPGTSCPTVAAVKSSDKCVVVVEPTVPSVEYCKQVLGLLDHFNKEYVVVANKVGIGDRCLLNELKPAFEIGYDERIFSLLKERKPPVALSDVKEVCEQILEWACF